LDQPYSISEDLLGQDNVPKNVVTREKTLPPTPIFPEPSDLLGKEKPRYNKLQECLLDYRTSMMCTRDKLKSSFGESELIMACTNLFARIMRAVIYFMAELSGKERAVELGLRIYELFQNLSLVGCRVIQNITEKTIFDELVNIFDSVVHLIDNYIPDIK